MGSTEETVTLLRSYRSAQRQLLRQQRWLSRASWCGFILNLAAGAVWWALA